MVQGTGMKFVFHLLQRKCGALLLNRHPYASVNLSTKTLHRVRGKLLREFSLVMYCYDL